MVSIGIVGCGFVADLYMRSFAAGPVSHIVGAYDINHGNLARFSNHWNIRSFSTVDELLHCLGPGALVLNLTNPSSHFEVSMRALLAGCHVYSEKPLAMDVESAVQLCATAKDHGLLLGSAPCSFLGESAQLLQAALHSGAIGRPRVVYAELDDDFLPEAPYARWHSESGAKWPAEDEFAVGCTLEHAGYYLTWLIATFGSISRVVAASASILPDLLPADNPAPDFSVATLFFENGVVGRLTCSIIAPHDHSLRVVGDTGILEVEEAWNNAAAVRLRKRFVIRRRLVNSPLSKRLRFSGTTHPKVGRWGAASMNFALGPLEMVEAIVDKRDCRISASLALHVTEVALAIHNAGATNGVQEIESRCDPIPLMPWATRVAGV